ncbi:hypothetical protein DRQ07_09295 [candidate division KSB1 bacterium]|nr:MAG: hypothetical protein DRQ07_09295 [candidate division KSB1 bacterium]
MLDKQLDIKKGYCKCINGKICCYCKKPLKGKELNFRKDPYPIKNKDSRYHRLCDPCEDI